MFNIESSKDNFVTGKALQWLNIVRSQRRIIQAIFSLKFVKRRRIIHIYTWKSQYLYLFHSLTISITQKCSKQAAEKRYQTHQQLISEHWYNSIHHLYPNVPNKVPI